MIAASNCSALITVLAATEALIRQKDQKHMGNVTFTVKFEMNSASGGASVSGKELQVKGALPESLLSQLSNLLRNCAVFL